MVAWRGIAIGLKLPSIDIVPRFASSCESSFTSESSCERTIAVIDKSILWSDFEEKPGFEAGTQNFGTKKECSSSVFQQKAIKSDGTIRISVQHTNTSEGSDQRIGMAEGIKD